MRQFSQYWGTESHPRRPSGFSGQRQHNPASVVRVLFMKLNRTRLNVDVHVELGVTIFSLALEKEFHLCGLAFQTRWVSGEAYDKKRHAFTHPRVAHCRTIYFINQS